MKTSISKHNQYFQQCFMKTSTSKYTQTTIQSSGLGAFPLTQYWSKTELDSPASLHTISHRTMFTVQCICVFVFSELDKDFITSHHLT